MANFYSYLLFKNTFILTISAFLLACTTRAANPVIVHQYGDRDKSCQEISTELTYIESEIERLVPESKKAGKNIVLGAAGAFLLFPWFFMDFTETEEIEIEAYRQRYNNLALLADEKVCGLDREVIPEQLPETLDKNEDNLDIYL